MAFWQTELRESLKTENLKGAVFIGLLIGLGTFWNGALMIAALLILGSAILWAPRRLELFIACAIATILAIVEAKSFITTGKGVAPHFQFGFVAETPSARGLAVYFLTLLGFLLPVLAVTMVMLRPKGRWLLASLLVPLVFASTFAFTPDVAVNHKFVNASVRIASIFAAILVIWLYDEGRLARAAAIALMFVLTATGAVDMISLVNFNLEKRSHDLADPFLVWALDSTSPDAVFASAPIFHSRPNRSATSSTGRPPRSGSVTTTMSPRVALLSRCARFSNRDLASAGITPAKSLTYPTGDGNAGG